MNQFFAWLKKHQIVLTLTIIACIFLGALAFRHNSETDQQINRLTERLVYVEAENATLWQISDSVKSLLFSTRDSLTRTQNLAELHKKFADACQEFDRRALDSIYGWAIIQSLEPH